MHKFHVFLLLIPLIAGQPGRKPSKPDTEALFGIPRDMWKCGPGESYITDQIILRLDETCPKAAADLNHCCAIHDDCYTNQRGRPHCDLTFCDCMAYQVRANPNAANCSSHTAMACGLVQQYGGQFYDASVNSTSDPVTRIPEEFSKISKQFSLVYEKCQQQQVTIASCALNFDLCYRNPTPTSPNEKCVVDLARCLDFTRMDRDFNADCDSAIELVLWKMVEKAETGNKTTLILAEIRSNETTFVRKVYYQFIRQSSVFPWYFYCIFFFFVILCCVFICVALSSHGRQPEEDRYRDEVINIHVSSSESSRRDSSESEKSKKSKNSKKSKK